MEESDKGIYVPCSYIPFPISQTNMNIEEWHLQLAAWRSKYKLPPTTIQYNPLEVSLGCKRCGKLKKKMSRHHKANDYLFACLLPDVYAARYLQFLKEDCDRLCENCHRHWHERIKPIVNEILHDASILKEVGEPIRVEWCEDWKKLILKKYEMWLKSPFPKRRKNGKGKRNNRSHK